MSKKNQKSNQLSLDEKRENQLNQMKKNNPALLKQDIFRLREQLQDLITKKADLKSLIDRNRDENVKQTFRLEVFLKQQEQKMVDIENEHNEKTTHYTDQLRDMLARFVAEQEKDRAAKNKEIEEKRRQAEAMKQKLAYLRQFPQRKRRYLQSIQELNERLQKMQRQQEKDLQNIHVQHLSERQKNDHDTESEMQRIKELEVNKLEQKMTTEQFIKKQNEVMESEIALCEEQLKVLREECESLRGQILAERAGTGENVLGGQANQTYERSLRIIKLESKLTKLKAYLAEETAKLEKQYDEIDTNYTRKQQESEARISKIEGWLRIKDRDLKKVKACAQMVLNQRSNLESYLLEVFYEHPEIDYKDERNINKVLRFLFSKINSKRPPLTYKNFLPESCKSLSSSDFRA